MANLYGSHFRYAGPSYDESWDSRTAVSSSPPVGLIFGNIETQPNRHLSGDISGITIFRNKEKKISLIADEYKDSPLSFEVEIVTDDQSPIPSHSKRRELENILFNRHEYKRLYLDMADDCDGETYETDPVYEITKHLFLRCRFMNPEKIEYNGGIVGWKATLEADSGYWWQDLTTKQDHTENTSASGNYYVYLNVDSDIDDYIYPTVTFKTGSAGGNVSIANLTDDSARQTNFVSLSPNSTVVLDGAVNFVTELFAPHFATCNFIRLLNGENTISVSGNVPDIKFEFYNRRSF